MSKSIQIRLSDDEHRLIKTALKGQNISKMIREFLLAETEKRLECSDMLLQVDSGLEAFLEALSSPAIQQALYKVFKQVG